MVSDETMMFSFGVEENRAEKVIKIAYQAMTEKLKKVIIRFINW